MTLVQDRALLRKHILSDAFLLAPSHKPGVDKPPRWTFDIRTISLDGACLSALGRLMWSQLAHLGPDVIAGPTLAADPLVSAVILAANNDGVNVSGIIVRRQAKANGLRKQLEGPRLRENSIVCVVDDVLNTGRSLLRTTMALRRAGHTIVGSCVVVDFERALAEWQKERPDDNTHLFTLSDLGVHSPKERAAGRRCKTSEVHIIERPHDCWIAAPGGGLISTSARRKTVDYRDHEGTIRWSACINGLNGGCRLFAAKNRTVVIAEGAHATWVDPVSGKLPTVRVAAGEVLDAAFCVADESKLVVAWSERNNSGILLCDKVGSQTPLATLRSIPTPSLAATQNCIYFGDVARRLVRVDLSGDVPWVTHLTGRVVGRPSTDGQLVYVATEDGYIVACSSTNGSIRWFRRVGTTCVSGAIWLDGHVFALGSSHATCLDAENGDLRWVMPAAEASTGWTIDPSPGSSGLIFAGQSGLQRLDVDTLSVEMLLSGCRPRRIFSVATGDTILEAADGVLAVVIR